MTVPPDSEGGVAQSEGVLRYLLDVHFEVTTAEKGDWTVVSVIGELDLSTAPALRQRVVALVNEGADHLVLDLLGTDFLDSIGLGVIVGALKRVQTGGGRLAVATDVHRIRSVFELTRLDQIIPLYTDVEEAIAGEAEGSDG